MSDPTVVRVNGPLVEIAGMGGPRLLDLVEVGPDRLPGEVIAIEAGLAHVQVHEYTGGLRPGAGARAVGGPLSAELGPGLLGGVFDGMMRRLGALGDFLVPGARAETLPRDRPWRFTPAVREGDRVGSGAVLGSVPETEAIEFRVLVPPDLSGDVEWVAAQGDYLVDEPVAVVGGAEIGLMQRWPVRRPRPIAGRIDASVPIQTGQRALDLLFPVARGSTAAVPGGFGTGKTLLLQQVAKWCDADVIVYVSCGERGNELADLLGEISTLEDPRTGRSLLDRIALIANTSNMPLMAREASVHSGVTVAELYRDMGYDVIVIADSTSRWAEALRELSSRTEELPAEEGYPADLAPMLAWFYERAARVQTLDGGTGSVTILGAISPPGGDMAEPVTAHTRRFVRNVWSLDRDLAYARHYPAVSWTDSSSRDAARIARWQADQGDLSWEQRRARAISLLAEADRVASVAELAGSASLPARERVVLLTGRLLREAVLQQSALSENDAWCGPGKQVALLEMVIDLHDRAIDLVGRGVPIERLEQADLSGAVRARDRVGPEDSDGVREVHRGLAARLEALA